MTAKEFYDYITKHMTPEQALLKLLEGQVMEYEHLKFSSEESAIHPLLLITMAAMEMDWVIAITNTDDNLESDVQGLVLGTEEYVDNVLKIEKELSIKEIAVGDVNELKLIEPNGQLKIDFEP